jgi:hypothetical protein
MKIITIKLTSVEATMLLELQKVEKEYGDINKLVKNLIRIKYEKMCA